MSERDEYIIDQQIHSSDEWKNSLSCSNRKKFGLGLPILKTNQAVCLFD